VDVRVEPLLEISIPVFITGSVPASDMSYSGVGRTPYFGRASALARRRDRGASVLGECLRRRRTVPGRAYVNQALGPTDSIAWQRRIARSRIETSWSGIRWA